ncbi:HAMP domain-containing histidine kinase [Micrococcales bacterium 31B]|nr:HAMP domain-containing histidine kinase [Micrococcales bacterium 31B]
MSLRRRLIALLLAVTVVGLVAAALIVNAIVGIALNSRAEAQLSAAEVRANTGFLQLDDQPLDTPDHHKEDHEAPYPGDAGPMDPGGTTAILFDSSNALVSREDPPFASRFDESRIPNSVLKEARADPDDAVRFTVGDYLGDAKQINANGDVAVTLVSTSGSADTMRLLVLTEVAVGAGVLLLVWAGSSLIIRVGLKPLRDMASTADSIAAGDTSLRLSRGGGQEVDRLATSLNSAFEARDASEARLRTFIADASHELRTPLTSIRGYAQLVERGIVTRPEDIRNAAGRIEKESSRLGGMVSTLLSLTRLDLGRSIDRKPVELTVLASDSLADARVGDPQRTYTLQARCSAPVLGDEAQLRQVLSNLLGNARDHTQPGTAVSIDIHAEGDDVVLDVKDHGPGVPEQFKDKIFDRFFRLDVAHGRNDKGHGGLGLSIVQAIVTAHEGSVEVLDTDATAAEGCTGATFRIRIPRAPGTSVGVDDDESYDEASPARDD